VAQLLTLMDDGADAEVDDAAAGGGRGKKKRRRLLRPTVVATTNRPNALDVALRRPGRFDVEVEVPLPSVEQRGAILRLHSRALPLAVDVDLAAVATRAKGYSGADLAGLCREAAMAAIRRVAAVGEGEGRERGVSGGGGGGASAAGVAPAMEVTAEDFVAAAARVGASVVRGVAVELPPTTWDDVVGGLYKLNPADL
jgi:transitional endoplasmic reticulum ATPase